MSVEGLSGKIKKLADVFSIVANHGQEGTLVVSDATSKKWLYFSKDGVRLLSAGSRQPSSLGQRLLSRGKLTKLQLDDAVLEYRKSGKRLGQVLVERNIVSQEEVEDVVRSQIAEEIFDLLEWEGADFEFIPGPPQDHLVNQPIGRYLPFDVTAILLEAAKRDDEWGMVMQKLNSLSEVLVPCTLYKTQLDLSGELSAAFALVDGKTSVRDMLMKLQMPRLEAAKLVGMLVETGAVRFATRDELLRLAQSPVLQGSHVRQAELYELALQRRDDPLLRQRWADVLERAGRRDQAAEQYKHLADGATRSGDLHAVADFLRQVVRLVPNDVESRSRLIDILLRLKSSAQAGVQIRRLAQVHAEDNKPDMAISEYRRLLKLSPHDFEAQKQLVELLVQVDRVPEAFHEAEVLEALARTPQERDQVIKFFGRLVATRPGFTEAQQKLERLSRHERRKVKVHRLSVRALIVLGVALAALAAWGIYEGLAAWDMSKAWIESETLARKGDYQDAIAVLRERLPNYTCSKAHRDAQRRIAVLLQQHQADEAARQDKVAQMRKSAADLEEKGDLKAASDALLWVAGETEKDNFLAGFQLRQKAAELLEFWNRSQGMWKHAQELAANESRVEEAHTEVLLLLKRFPKPAAFLGVKLPVVVLSTPVGADVTAEGRRVGKTPVVVWKTPGKATSIAVRDTEARAGTRTLDNDDDWKVVVTLRNQKP